MELSDYLRVFRRNWLTIAASVLVGLLVAASASLLAKPSYTARVQLFVAIQSSGTVTELQQGNTFTQARVQSYVKTANTPAVLQPVIESLSLELSAAELASKIEASADLDTVLITVAASDQSPVQAAAIAEAVGVSLIETVEKLEQPSAGGVSPVRLSVITPAVAPTSASSPRTGLNLSLGLVAGLFMGLGIAVLKGTIDTRVRGEGDLRNVSDMPVLGGLAFDNDASKKPLLTQTPHQSPRAESYRQIRTNLQFANVGNKSKSLLVTSSVPGEGKTTTATNMAIALAQAGQRVLLVDADLRRPMVAEYLGLERNAGLTTALVGTATAGDLLQPWGEDQLYVLTAGVIPPNPSELLGSGAMEHLLRELETAFDVVIIDAPPLIPVTDASVLAQQVGGVVLVVGAGKIRTQELEKSIAALELVGANILGAVLNRLPSKGPDAYTYSYYSYDSNTETKRNGSKEPKRRRLDASRATSSRRSKSGAANLDDSIR